MLALTPQTEDDDDLERGIHGADYVAVGAPTDRAGRCNDDAAGTVSQLSGTPRSGSERLGPRRVDIEPARACSSPSEQETNKRARMCSF
jgi:hypothetical protein